MEEKNDPFREHILNLLFENGEVYTVDWSYFYGSPNQEMEEWEFITALVFYYREVASVYSNFANRRLFVYLLEYVSEHNKEEYLDKKPKMVIGNILSSKKMIGEPQREIFDIIIAEAKENKEYKTEYPEHYYRLGALENFKKFADWCSKKYKDFPIEEYIEYIYTIDIFPVQHRMIKRRIN